LPILSSGEAGGRPYNRTNALIDALADRLFGDAAIDGPTRGDIATVISATDLRTTNAVRFGSERSSCSRFGTITTRVPVADAVAASAAYPLLLPGLERRYTFARAGETTVQSVLLTDGGVYDNLGLTPLERGRSPSHTGHVYELDYIIACDAGRGKPAVTASPLMPRRLKRSFEITYRRAQDATRGRLFEDRVAGRLRGFAHVYLGTNDDRVPIPIADLADVRKLRHYPTDFRGMDRRSIEGLSTRAEQLTRVLIEHYCPELL
jgi:NTE family protein